MPSTGPRPKADLTGRVRAALERAEQVAAERSSALTARDPAKLKALGKEHARLEPIVRSGGRFLKLSADLVAARELADGDDGEMAALAREEVAGLEPRRLHPRAVPDRARRAADHLPPAGVEPLATRVCARADGVGLSAAVLNTPI